MNQVLKKWLCLNGGGGGIKSWHNYNTSHRAEVSQGGIHDMEKNNTRMPEAQVQHLWHMYDGGIRNVTGLETLLEAWYDVKYIILQIQWRK